MITSFELEKIIEKWWANLDNPMDILETLDNITISDIGFRNWGYKNYYCAKKQAKFKVTITYIKTFQSLEPVENKRGEIVYPLLEIYIDINHNGSKRAYKKVRCHVSC